MPGAYGLSGHSAWLDLDWRAHQRFVTVDDRLVNIVELGSGPPLLFVHGSAAAGRTGWRTCRTSPATTA
jgi:hypothetical protein